MQASPQNSSTRHKPVIGLIGGIGSGKSLVARQFGQLGCGIIDSDQLARQAMMDPAIRNQLVAWWGEGVLKAPESAEASKTSYGSGDRGIDRQAVARIAFGNPAELARLEDLIHPLVHAGRAELRQRYDADPAVRAIVEDTPLLVEKGLDRQCDVLVFVESSRANRLRRVRQSRHWNEAELDRRESQQLGLDIKADKADYIVDNNAGPDECFRQVRQVLTQILQTPPQ